LRSYQKLFFQTTARENFLPIWACPKRRNMGSYSSH